jgi:hypothetical protein
VAGIGLALLVGVAFAGTDLDNTDRAIVGTASTDANPANLECGGAAVNIQLNVVADNGNIPSNPQYPASGTVTVPTSLTITGTGVTAAGSQSQTFTADQNFNTTNQTLSFTIALSADATANPGAQSFAITFGTTGTMVLLGGQVTLDPGFTNPTVYANVTCASYEIVGFYQPVRMDAYNGSKAGSTIPLKFDIVDGDGVEQTDTSLVDSLIQRFTCNSGTETDMLETEELSSGNTTLRWDDEGEQFVFNWKTPKTPGCYRVTLIVEGGDSIYADFQLK